MNWGEGMSDKKKYKVLPPEIAKNVDALMDAAPCGSGIFGMEEGDAPYYFNTQLCNITGYSEEEMRRAIKADSRSLVYQEDWDVLDRAKNSIINTGIIRGLTYRSHKKGGGICWISLNVTRIDTESGKIFYYASFMDITTQVANSEKAQAVKEWESNRYRVIVEQLGMVVFEWNLSTGDFYSSDQYYLYELSETDRYEFLHKRMDMRGIYEEDVPIFVQFVEEVEKHNSFSSCVVRLKMKDGSYQWSKICISFVKDNGKFSRVVGTIQNTGKRI